MERSTNGDSSGLNEPVAQCIIITVDAQEIGALYATRSTPNEFMQYLLERFKAAGVPVEGVIRLRLAHGVVLRFKRNPPGAFKYIWLPEVIWERVKNLGGLLPY